MSLDWTFSFVYIEKNKPNLEMMLSFSNGKSQIVATPRKYPEVIAQMDSLLTLILYVAYFPNKDFTKIKLKTAGNRYAFHFIDKRYLKTHNFLGILSVTEYNTDKIFENWGVEEMMAKYFFDYYIQMKKSEEFGPIRIQDFHKWISTEIKEFFVEWYDAKKVELKKKKKRKYKNLNSDLKKHIKHKGFEHWWDIQLINEYGAPLTELITFIDENAFFSNTEDEETYQSLESMSISALKILIDQSEGAWNIKYLKNRLKNKMGYQYVFFEKFSVRGVKYLLIMNSSIYDFKREECLQAIRGIESDLLDLIAGKLAHHTMFFSKKGQLTIENRDIIQKIMLNYISNVYR